MSTDDPGAVSRELAAPAAPNTSGSLFGLRFAAALGPLLIVAFVLRPASRVTLFVACLAIFAAVELLTRAVAKNAPDRVSNLTLVFGLVSGAGLIASLVLSTFQNTTVYAMGVDRLVGEKGKWVGRHVRVEGMLVQHTLRFREQPCEYIFDATKGNAVVHVRYPSCIKPDTLRDDMPEVGVTAEGKLQADGTFVATNVLAKCPSKYDMKTKPGGSVQTPGAPPPNPASLLP